MFFVCLGLLEIFWNRLLLSHVWHVERCEILSGLLFIKYQNQVCECMCVYVELEILVLKYGCACNGQCNSLMLRNSKSYFFAKKKFCSTFLVFFDVFQRLLTSFDWIWVNGPPVYSGILFWYSIFCLFLCFHEVATAMHVPLKMMLSPQKWAVWRYGYVKN